MHPHYIQVDKHIMKKKNSGQGNHATLARAFSLLTFLAAEELIIISTHMLCSDKIQHITLLLLNE